MSPPGAVPDVSSRVLDEDAPLVLPNFSPSARSTGAELAHRRAQVCARRRTYGRHRSARRLTTQPYAPPPGWRQRLAAAGVQALTDQAAALERVADLVDAERWRSDRHEAWSAMLAALVHHMDWNTGLATVPRQVLADVGGVDVRTVTTMLRWAREVGLLYVIEAGATAAFLGTTHNRAQTYAVVIPAGTTPPPAPGVQHRSQDDLEDGPQRRLRTASSTPADLHGDARIYPPASCVKDLTLAERRKDPKTPGPAPVSSWPLWQVPETPAERAAATATLARRLGISRRIPTWRLQALLACWWRAGACPAGLLHAIDHHPDQPTTTRGDALRGARDPIRVLGHRLQPWLGHLDRLPHHLHGHRGDYRAAQTDRLERLMASASVRTPRKLTPASSVARDKARAAIRAHLARTSVNAGRTDSRRAPAGHDRHFC